MPAKQSHRGKHPEDEALFSERWLPVLRRAVSDMSWLLSRGYARAAALKLVGDHFQLATRQRTAVDRCACPEGALAARSARELAAEAMRSADVYVDGYNLLITVECALSGGILLKGRDGCIRDMASLHGSYRRVEETQPAVELIGAVLARLAPARVIWMLDAPVSNSARLKTLIGAHSRALGWPWECRLLPNPDTALAESSGIVVSADSWVLDHSGRWHNLAGTILEELHLPVPVIDLGRFSE